MSDTPKERTTFCLSELSQQQLMDCIHELREMCHAQQQTINALKARVEKALALTVGDYSLLSERIQEALR